MKKHLLLLIICIVFAITITGCIWSLDNPSDSHAEEYTVKSEASLSIQSRKPYYQNSTISVWGGVSSKPVEDSGLVNQFLWDFGNDGIIDTILYRSAILNIPLKKPGSFSISLHLTDALGYVSSAVATINVTPQKIVDTIPQDTTAPIDTTIPIDTTTPSDTVAPHDTDLISIIDVMVDSDCAFYTQSEYTMKPVAMMGRYFSYKNKTESMSLGSFVFELLKNLTGTIDYNALVLPYSHSFTNGVYTLSNGNLTMKAVFLYGTTVQGHHEVNDTIRYDLFDPRSYIKSFSTSLKSPYYTYEKGPLWDLTSGFSVNTSNPLSPKISMKIDMSSLKFAGFREVQSRYTLSSQITDSNQVSLSFFDVIAFKYQGLARIEPFFIRDIVSKVQNDSFEIDMSGSVIETDSFPITFRYVEGSKLKEKTFNFFIRQQMLNQLVRFGNSGNNLKVIGSYAAESKLSVNQYSLISSYFSGYYSTSEADTASFYCDRAMQSGFGILYFAVPQSGFLTFISERYSYQFSIVQGSIMP